jgi:hypothetical protein
MRAQLSGLTSDESIKGSNDIESTAISDEDNSGITSSAKRKTAG